MTEHSIASNNGDADSNGAEKPAMEGRILSELSAPVTLKEEEQQRSITEEKIVKDCHRESDEKPKYKLSDALPLMREAVENMVEDDFTQCFQSRPRDHWNWNIYLFPAWCLGVIFRYCVLFPMRLTAFMLGVLMFFTCFFFVRHFVTDQQRRATIERALFRFMFNVFVMSWSGVIKFHGVRPARRANQVFVSNHSSPIDYIILSSQGICSVVGQLFPGWVGVVQANVLSALGCIWFNRNDLNDRHRVAKRLKDHVQNPLSNPLLIFPEGTCTNNEYIVMFKRGAFDLGATVVPVAIRYNKIFVDAFWNTKQQSFGAHLLRLMTSWAVVCDIWYLEPQTLRGGEDPTAFAERVKAMIAKKARLTSVPWDGYLKHYKPSPRFMEARQRQFADALLRRSLHHTLSVVPSQSGHTCRFETFRIDLRSTIGNVES